MSAPTSCSAGLLAPACARGEFERLFYGWSSARWSARDDGLRDRSCRSRRSLRRGGLGSRDSCLCTELAGHEFNVSSPRRLEPSCSTSSSWNRNSSERSEDRSLHRPRVLGARADASTTSSDSRIPFSCEAQGTYLDACHEGESRQNIHPVQPAGCCHRTPLFERPVSKSDRTEMGRRIRTPSCPGGLVVLA
jgi:hypothetical protein